MAEQTLRFVEQLRARVTADADRFAGYAIVFNSLSEDLGGFYERILPSAVDRTLRSGNDIAALADHRRDTSSILGSTESGLLTLTKDAIGLRFDVRPPDTTDVRDLATRIRSGLVSGASFAFKLAEDGERWSQEGGLTIRTLTDFTFSEISIVVNPAYLATTVSARSRELDEQAFERYRLGHAPWRPSAAYLRRHLIARGIPQPRDRQWFEGRLREVTPDPDVARQRRKSKVNGIERQRSK